MRRLSAYPWRLVARWARLLDGRELYVLSCGHERIDPALEELDVPRNSARCPYCIGGVDAIVPIERVPV